jgi:hypothetical protein
MLPESNRFAAFREEFAPWVLTTVDRGGRPRIDETFMRLGAAAVGSMAGTWAEFIRRKHHLQPGNDDFNVNVIDPGPIVFAQAGGAGCGDGAGAEVRT